MNAEQEHNDNRHFKATRQQPTVENGIHATQLVNGPNIISNNKQKN